jgi:hypothetical protein
MIKRTFLVLGAMGLMTGALLTAAGLATPAEAGEWRTPSVGVHFDAPDPFHAPQWVFHSWSFDRHEAFAVGRRLELRGFEWKVEQWHGRWYVYHRFGH